jgi:hypothetical protein
MANAGCVFFETPGRALGFFLMIALPGATRQTDRSGTMTTFIFPTRGWFYRWTAAVLCVACSGAASAQGPAEFSGADLKLGEQLIAQHACASCHATRMGGDGSAIYRPQGRINTARLLHSMVEMCSVQLKLALFPEEVVAIAAVLNRDHYRFAEK